jgi:sarcosine oxidase/L-pipecolate oxidase
MISCGSSYRHSLSFTDLGALSLQNKIIRTEYDEPLYAEMALEAIQAWRDPLYKDIFHETGWILTTLGDPKATAHLQKSYENLKAKGQAHNIDFVKGKDEIAKYVPQLKNARDIENWKGLWNKQAGWAHAANAIQKIADEAGKMGVKFISGAAGEMISLVTTDSKVTGVKVKSGDVYTADRYILSTGAASPALLPELHPTMEQMLDLRFTRAHRGRSSAVQEYACCSQP